MWGVWDHFIFLHTAEAWSVKTDSVRLCYSRFSSMRSAENAWHEDAFGALRFLLWVLCFCSTPENCIPFITSSSRSVSVGLCIFELDQEIFLRAGRSSVPGLTFQLNGWNMAIENCEGYGLKIGKKKPWMILGGVWERLRIGYRKGDNTDHEIRRLREANVIRKK